MKLNIGRDHAIDGSVVCVRLCEIVRQICALLAGLVIETNQPLW